jgi:hypothetical protein
MRSQSLSHLTLWVWADLCEANLKYDYRHLAVDRVFRTRTTLGVYGRFAIAMFATTPYVAIIDDDIICGSGYLENCLETLERYEGVIAAGGVRFLSNSYLPCERFGWEKRTCMVTEVDIGCNAWFLRKSWLPYLWLEQPYNWQNGEDMRLSYLAQKFGGIKTFTPAQSADRDCGSVEHFGKDAVAVSATSDHYKIRTMQLREQLRKGWRTMQSNLQLFASAGH